MTQEFAIVPKVATDEMETLFYRHCGLTSNIYGGDIENFLDGYQAAISAAPPHNLVAIDKDELERLRNPWQPIETAPRHKEVMFGQMVKFSDGEKWKTYTGLKYVINEEVGYSISTKLLFFCPEPTHWCELPTPPQGGVK